jgi:hypothetical protein
VPRRDFPVGLKRPGFGRFFQYGDEGVKRRIACADPIQATLEHSLGRERA